MAPMPEQADRVDGARSVRGVRRRRAAVRWSSNRTWGVIGIEMPLRSIEDVALADGACRNLTAPTNRTCNSGAADRECLLVQLKSRRVAKDHDARSSQMRSS